MNNENIDLAAKVHYSFLPDSFNNKFVEIAVTAKPKDKIGGDYCSILPFNDKKLIVCLCDVVGHGIASALYAARINTFVVTQAMKYHSPAKLINLLNEFLYEQLANSGLFTTFCAIIFDFDKQVIKFASAAQPPVLHFQKEKKEIELLTSDTTFLGIMESLPDMCCGKQSKFKSGDKIILHTDGLSETRNEKREIFGTKSVTEFTKKNHALDNVTFNRKLIETSLNYNSGEISDDILLMTISIK